MAPTIPGDKYPNARTDSEATRLHAQHHLTKGALGGLVLCPLDTHRSGLRILDSGTADGYFLLDLYSELEHAESATMIGTDISTYPGLLDLPSNVKLLKQDILSPWPEDWKGTFDFVHQRHTMASAGSFEQAIKVTRSLFELLKPGGWLQLVDGELPSTAIETDDAPSTKLFKCIGQMMQRIGLDPSLGSQLPAIMQKATGLVEVDHSIGVSRIGRNAPEHLVEIGYAQLCGLRSSVSASLSKLPSPPLSSASFNDVVDLATDEAREKGIEMRWYAAWGQRTW